MGKQLLRKTLNLIVKHRAFERIIRNWEGVGNLDCGMRRLFFMETELS